MRSIAWQLLLLTIWCASATAQPSNQSESVLGEIRSSLFETANGALSEANTASANILSPTAYARGADYYRRAEATLEAGGNIDAIRRDLERATEAFQEAAVQARGARETFKSTLKARQDAMSIGAESYAREEWQAAARTFANATEQFEKGRIERAERDGAQAQIQFRAAELSAIKANYLDETRRLLEQAQEAKADRYAPRSFESARNLLEEAEAVLDENRYDTDKPRNLALAARHSAAHAIYVAGLEAAIREKNLTLEDVLMDWEGSIEGIARLLNTPVRFDQGETEAVAAIEEAIAALLSETRRLNGALEERQAQLDTLIEETASMERLARLVARQERQKQRLDRVESLFEIDEVIVLRQQDSIILRMIGLNFDVASSELTEEHEPLLAKLRTAIAEFPESNIVVEGHTDSFGSESDNLSLSQLRADALQQYLLSNSPISPVNLTALGYGESRPVASNEIEAGRTQNRRIDVVIYPKW